jgi:hypothetical protein
MPSKRNGVRVMKNHRVYSILSKRSRKPSTESAVNNNNQKRITWAEYDAKMGEIIRRHPTVADALIEMLQYTASVEVR